LTEVKSESEEKRGEGWRHGGWVYIQMKKRDKRFCQGDKKKAARPVLGRKKIQNEKRRKTFGKQFFKKKLGSLGGPCRDKTDHEGGACAIGEEARGKSTAGKKKEE